MKYEALLACDVSEYATVEFEATSDEAAIEEAKRLYHDADDFHVEWDNTSNDRIVHVERIQRNGKHKTIAEDIDLKPNPLHDHAFALLQAAKAVQEWAGQLGGWEASCWTVLESAIARCEGHQ